jgi:hypothetical protein
MNGKKIEISVPDGYDFVQDGLDIKFVKKSNSKWEDKDSKVVGYYINKDSKVVNTCAVPRLEKHSNIFHKESQAVGSLALARLTQQLADANGDWEPDWTDGNESKYCIYRSSDKYKVFCSDVEPEFLAFKTEEDAKEFLSTNIKEIKLAKDFI